MLDRFLDRFGLALLVIALLVASIFPEPFTRVYQVIDAWTPIIALWLAYKLVRIERQIEEIRTRGSGSREEQ